MLLTSASKSDVGIGLIRLLSIQPTSVLDVRCEFHHSYGGRVGLCERHSHRLRGHRLVVVHGGRLEADLVSKITAIGERSCRQTLASGDHYSGGRSKCLHLLASSFFH